MKLMQVVEIEGKLCYNKKYISEEVILMKKIRIILLILILITIITIMFPIVSRASATINPNTYEPNKLQESDVSGFETFGGSIAGVIQIIGTMVSVGTMIILGIRYVAASADEKAEYRERMIPYFIGAVLLFGASNIVSIIYKIF